MSDGHAREVTFVDLDGTLVLDNSFHIFTWALLSEGSWAVRRRLFWAFGRRLLRTHNRVAMKRALLAAYASAPARVREAIVSRTLASLRRTLSAPVLAHIQARRELGPVVLATAAAESYARPFAAELGLDDCIVVHTPDATFVARRGDENAIKRLVAQLKERGLEKYL